MGRENEIKSIYTMMAWVNEQKTLIVSSIHDETPNIRDDELFVDLIIVIRDPEAIRASEEIDIASPKSPVKVLLGVSCFCYSDMNKKPGEYQISGSVIFDHFSSERIEGGAHIYLEGDIPFSDTQAGKVVDIWREDTNIEISIPRFIYDEKY